MNNRPFADPNDRYSYEAWMNNMATDDLHQCQHCGGEGRVEMDNNGPIGDCPICGGTGLKPNAGINARGAAASQGGAK